MARGTSRLVCWLMAIALLVGIADRCQAQAMAPTRLGGNLERIRDWSRSNSFVDVVKQSRGFFQANTGLSIDATLDQNGWPTEDFDVILMTDIDGVQGLSGTYKVTGLSNLAPDIVGVATDITVTNLQHNFLNHTFSADVTLAAASTGFILSFRNTGGGVKNLRVLRPGYPATNTPTFTTQFLNHIARFSTLRFMEWTQTNGHPVSRWADRTPISSPTYFVDSGVPWEVCIELANITQKDMWINVPHMADDEYIKNLAQLVRDTLSPNLHVYVEHSNEVWNSLFSQCAYNLAGARAAPASLQLSYDGNTSDTIINARYHAWRTKQIADIFNGAFGTEYAARVRMVLAGQQVEPAILYTGLDYLERMYGPPANFLSGVATAPYFHMGDFQFVDNLTPSQVFDSLRSSVNAIDTEALFEQNARMARWFGLPMLAYEGGSDTSGGTSLESKRLALMDPRMYDLCSDYLRTWFSWGFGQFEWFTGGATSWRVASGGWGLTDDMTVQNTYRILAFDAVRNQGTVPVTKGLAIPGVVDARRQVDRPADWATRSESLDELLLNQDIDYVLNAPYSGTLRVRLGMGCENPGNEIRVSINDTLLGNLPVPVSGSLHVYVPSQTMLVPFTAGLNVLRLHVLEQGHYSLLNVQVLCPLDLDDNGSAADGLNPDGGVDINDLIVFLTLFESGDPRVDVDDDGVLPPRPDGAVDINDLLFLLGRFEAGC